MSEMQRSPEAGENPEAIDRALELYAEHPLANLETYKYFNQKGEGATQAKNAFVEASLAGQTPAAPDFDYPDINVDQLMSYRNDFADMLALLPTDKELSGVGKIVRENITNRLHEVGIMLLTKMQSELDEDDPRYEAISFQLAQNMREVYGMPDTEHFRGILGYRLSQLAEVELRDDVPEHIQDAWQFIKSSLPEDLPVEKPYKLKSETTAWYKAQLDERLAPARAAVTLAITTGEVVLNNDRKLVGPEIVKAAKFALEAYGAEGWTAAETDEANIDTTQSQKTIFIPTTREMTMDQFDQVMLGHEIDEHVGRRVNGDNSGVKVLGGTGANGYLAWEEGNGKVNEALIKGKVSNETSAFAYYLSGGLALGLEADGGKGRSFGQTADLVWRMNFIADYLKGKNEGAEDARRAYVEKAATRLTRIFRGTDGRTPGTVFTKDVMTYYLGQAQVFQKWDRDMELSEEERLREHKLERIAKIDPLRNDHRAVASALL